MKYGQASLHYCRRIGTVICLLVVLPAIGCLSLDPDFLSPIEEHSESGLDSQVSHSDGSWRIPSTSMGETLDTPIENAESSGTLEETTGTSAETVGTDSQDGTGSTGDEDSSDLSDESANSESSNATDPTNSTDTGISSTDSESSTDGSTDSSTDTGNDSTDSTSSSDTGNDSTDSTSSSDTGTSTSDTGNTPCVPQLCYSVNANQSIRSGAYAEGGSIYAAAWTASATQYVVRAEIPTGSRSGTGELFFWSYNNGQYPGNYLGGGEWEVKTTVSWQGADISPSIPVDSNTQYWIGWSLPHQAQFPIANTGIAMEHRWSTNGGASWNDDHLDQRDMFRIYCCDEPPE